MKYKVHLICNAHLDPVWQWRWTEGCSEALMTFRNAVDILGEYPELVFNHNEAILYQWVQKYDPKLFARIQELAASGRWFISGGWFLQPDLNLPPVENLVRNIRMGKAFFRKYFDAEPKVAYNFDSFGHPGTLPGILREHGYDMYIHQRPEKEFLALPADLYNWKGLDGSCIPAYRIEIGLYHNERSNIEQRLREGADMALSLGRDVAVFWGLGDHGGGATRSDLEKIRLYVQSDNRVGFLHSTTDRFFEAIRPLIQDAPVFEGSLQRIFTGCYTSLSRIKRKALEASGAALQAEQLLLFAESDEHLAQQLADIWNDIIFNDFHDILPGSCTEPAENDALELYGRALENIRRLNLQSITRFNHAGAPFNACIPVTLFNSNPGLTTFPVEFECMSDYRPLWVGKWMLELFGADGRKIPCQEEQPEALLPFHSWRRKISFLATGLGAGIHHFEVKATEMTDHKELAPGENQERTAPDRSSPIFHPSCIVVHDRADSWGTSTWAWRELAGIFSTDDGSVRIIEEGPVRAIKEQVMSYNQSKMIVHQISYPGWPVREYKIRIHWNEQRMRLKLVVPVHLLNPRLKAEIPGGAEFFPPDGQEHVHGRWLELGEDGGSMTEAFQPSPLNRRLFIAHTGLHGFDFDGREVRLSVLRSAAYCHEQGFNLDNGPHRKFMDQGVHDIRLALWEDPAIDPAAVAGWLITPPLVWPHLPIGG